MKKGLRVLVMEGNTDIVVYTVPAMKKWVKSFPSRNKWEFYVGKDGWAFMLIDGKEKSLQDVKRIGRPGEHPDHSNFFVMVFDPRDDEHLNVLVLQILKNMQKNIRLALGLGIGTGLRLG